MMLRDGLIHLIMIKKIKNFFQLAKIKKVPGLFKDELGGKIITECASLRAKAYLYLDDDGNKHRKSKGTKKCVIKQNSCFKISKISCLITRLFLDHRKDLKFIIMVCTLKK